MTKNLDPKTVPVRPEPTIYHERMRKRVAYEINRTPVKPVTEAQLRLNPNPSRHLLQKIKKKQKRAIEREIEESRDFDAIGAYGMPIKCRK